MQKTNSASNHSLSAGKEKDNVFANAPVGKGAKAASYAELLLREVPSFDASSYQRYLQERER